MIYTVHTYLQVVKYTGTSMPSHITGNIVLQYFFTVNLPVCAAMKINTLKKNIIQH